MTVQKLKSKVATTGFAFLISTFAFAQNNAAPAAVPQSSGGNDIFWYMLIVVMAILLVAVMLLSGILLNLARLIANKNTVAKVVAVLLMLTAASGLFAQGAPAEAPKADANYNLPDWNIVMAAVVLITELFAVVVLLLRIRLMLNQLAAADKPAAEHKPFNIHLPKLFDKINASVSVEHEKDVLLDHNYDGIQELDNNLPPWWVYGFYFTIIFAVVYISYYTLGGGPGSTDEYVKEMDEAKIARDEYMRKNALNVDENTVTLADAAGIAEGKTLFDANCTPCHGKLGEGIVGPNLTDDYWLHGGSIKDVFRTIKMGWPAKGMKSWQTDLTPIQIKQVASYVKSLHGTNPPNGKVHEGDLYNENAAAPVDSTGVKNDTTAHIAVNGK